MGRVLGVTAVQVARILEIGVSQSLTTTLGRAPKKTVNGRSKWHGLIELFGTHQVS